MKKGYYIFCGSNSSGVNNKIQMQIRELGKHYDVELIKVTQNPKSALQKIKSAFPMASKGYKYNEALDHMDNPAFIYVRRNTADVSYVKFFQAIKNRFPSCKVIIEYPVYPYFRESYIRSPKHFFRFAPDALKDKIYTGKLKGLVDRIVTYSLDKEINGVPTINTMNGVDVASYNVTIEPDYNKGRLDLLAVAMFQPYHGYERIIEGMNEHYRKKSPYPVYLHMVGNGTEVEKYKILVDKYGLGKYVSFEGVKTGNDLDAVYDKCDVGLDCFGRYKDKLYYVSTIKAKEYLAKGIPVVTGVKEDFFATEPSEFCLEFPNDPSAVQIERIIEFYDGLKRKYEAKNLRKAIRQLAEARIDNGIVMKQIVDFIKD
jgi:hypothetical protein